MDTRQPYSVIAIDLGASSGRLIRATLTDGKINLKEIYRFENQGIPVHGRLYTDVLGIYLHILKGLELAWQEMPRIDSIAIDSWGVDFALLDRQGELMRMPYHYRDPQSGGMLDSALELFGAYTLFERTGVQDMWYNSVYQLMGIENRKGSLVQQADCFLMIPDLFAYMLTGEKSLEYTSIATTQLYDYKRSRIDDETLHQLHIDPAIFPPIKMTGEVKGYLTQEVCKRTGIPITQRIPVRAAAQHDTASAAYAVPALTEPYLFISSGTWSIIGTVLPEPIVTKTIYESGYSNEGAAFGKIKLVQSFMGMWLIQELRKSWKRRGMRTDYDYLLHAASQSAPFSHYLAVEDPSFVAPADMLDAVKAYFKQTGQPETMDQGVLYRTVIESLALQYRYTIDRLEQLTDTRYKTIHFLGGAVRDPLFCQFIANASVRKVTAGPIEATATGNALTQLRAIGAISERETAEIIRASLPIADYLPTDEALWQHAYERYKSCSLDPAAI